jgi:hypothetical protein
VSSLLTFLVLFRTFCGELVVGFLVLFGTGYGEGAFWSSGFSGLLSDNVQNNVTDFLRHEPNPCVVN